MLRDRLVVDIRPEGITAAPIGFKLYSGKRKEKHPTKGGHQEVDPRARR